MKGEAPGPRSHIQATENNGLTSGTSAWRVGRNPRIHPALAALKDIYNAEDIDKAQVAVKVFEIDFGAKYPKAVDKIVDDLDMLLEGSRVEQHSNL